MIIKIEGKQGEGKITLARKIVGKKKAVFVCSRSLCYKDWLLCLLDEKIDFLVVDDVVNIKSTKSYLTKSTFNVRRPYSQMEENVKLPKNIILIKQGK